MRRSIPSGPVVTCAIWVLASLGCAITPTIHPQQSSIRHDAPDIKKGTYWKWKVWSSAAQRYITLEEMVERVDDNLITFKVRSDGEERWKLRRYRDRSLRLVAVNERHGSLNQQPYAFPLYVGKKWTHAYEARAWTGALYKYRNEYEIAAYEKIRTKAGTFWAYRIERTNYNLDANTVDKITRWYAPEVMRWVRWETSWGKKAKLLEYRVPVVSRAVPEPTRAAARTDQAEWSR